ncbi:hydrogen peroxide-inducible regulon activator [Salmonella enterica subsp. enterica serovar Bovismorbificans]|nr:hydrogen peroxide-inducible regulon activator [Salmonella enterica subsp. enterica serovar Bovismorbificans]
MNIRDLEYLVALAEHRHFRRAADSCHVSQPTLSGQIRKLEDELGVMLLERTSRKVLFTQAGLLLVDQARTVLREVKVLKEMAKPTRRDDVRPAAYWFNPNNWSLFAAAYHSNVAPDFPEAGNVSA